MPRLPQNIFHFTDAAGQVAPGARARINIGDTHHAQNTDAVQNLPDKEAALAEELQNRKLFLDTLTSMLHQHGHDLDAQTLCTTFARHLGNTYPLFTSQPLIHIRSFPKHYAPATGIGESSTRYHFIYGFHADNPEHPQFRVPKFEIDGAAWDTLKSYCIPSPSSVEEHNLWHALQLQYCEQFLRIDALSDHDYLHQIVAPLARTTHETFRINERPSTGTYEEDHALILQAEVCRTLFAQHPSLKRRTLQAAVDTLTMLGEIQQAAYAHATTPRARRKVDEAITYLTEIYINRFFRVISPADPDLRQPPDAHDPAHPSVAQAFDTLTLLMPSELVSPGYTPRSLYQMPRLAQIATSGLRTAEYWLSHLNRPGTAGLDGLAQATRLAEYNLGDTYTRIHTDAAKQIEILSLGMKVSSYNSTHEQGYAKPFNGPRSKVHCVGVIPRMLPTALEEMDKARSRVLERQNHLR